jgi:hypothetical protein
MRYYRPLGFLAASIHEGGAYIPLSAERAAATPEWAPVVPLAAGTLPAGDGAHGAAGAAAAAAGGAAGAAALRMALQRLFLPQGPGPRRRPMFLYVNHLGELSTSRLLATASM